MMSLRVKQRRERTDRIIRAAEDLIRETGGTDFSMRSLAEAAEVSQTTPYNLFGTKENLLSCLLLDCQARAFEQGEKRDARDPLEFLVQRTEATVKLLIDDKELLRPLCRYLLTAAEAEAISTFRETSFDYWIRISQRGVFWQKKETDPTVEEVEVGHALYACFTGSVQQWLNASISDELFRLRSVYGSLLIAVRYIRETDRDRIDKMIEAALEELENYHFNVSQTQTALAM